MGALVRLLLTALPDESQNPYFRAQGLMRYAAMIYFCEILINLTGLAVVGKLMGPQRRFVIRILRGKGLGQIFGIGVCVFVGWYLSILVQMSVNCKG